MRLIVADDLTGAADACVKLAAGSRSASVVPDLDRATPALLARTGLVSLSLDTRRRPASDVRLRMRRAADAAGDRATASVFLKIDSTLRGHLAEEIASALEVFGCTHAILTPAFPAMNRRVAGGILYVDGPGAPPPIDIRARLASQGLDVDRVRIADASTRGDLERVVRTGLAGGGRPLWVGSAGLAEALGAVERARSPHEPHQGLERPTPRPGPVVVAIGSTHPATAAQRTRLQSRSKAQVLSISPGEWRTAVRQLDELMRTPIAGLVLTGGDTATSICAALHADAIDLGGEIADGVPWGLVCGGRADGLPVVLKAGGFGGPDTLVDAVDFLSATMAEDKLAADSHRQNTD